MRFLDLTLPSLEENLALDEALVLQADEGEGEVLRFWEWPSEAVVLGAGGKLLDDVNEPACRTEGVYLARRSSGGGTVLLGAGCLLFSLVLSYRRDRLLSDLHGSYHWILSHILAGLAKELSGLERQGISDLTWQGKKFSGNAQQRKRDHLLHHGTLLYQFDLARIGRFLHPPPRQPDYRQQRSHAEFVANLPLSRETVRAILQETFPAQATTGDWPRELVQRLVRQKYGTEDWLRRR